MSARTDALMSQQEAGKIAASIVLRYGRLSPGVSGCFNARADVCFLAFPMRRWPGRSGTGAMTKASISWNIHHSDPFSENTFTARTNTANDWTPDHAVMSGNKDQLKALPQFKYSDYN
jgi:hypothetical protein